MPVFLARKGYYRRPVMAALARPARRADGAHRGGAHSTTQRTAERGCVFKSRRERTAFSGCRARARGEGRTARPRSTCSPAPRPWKSVSTSARYPAWRCAICPQVEPITSSAPDGLAAVATPLRPWSHSAARTATTSIICRTRWHDPRRRDRSQANPGQPGNHAASHPRVSCSRTTIRTDFPNVDPSQPHDLFSVLGTVSGFRDGKAMLNIHDFKEWLTEQRSSVARTG